MRQYGHRRGAALRLLNQANGIVQPDVSRASIEVWNLSRYLVPERKAGSALLFIGFDFYALSGGELIGERLIRLGLGENCAFAQTEHDKTYSLSGKEKIIATRTTIFTASFSGSFLRVQRDGKPMEPDSVID